MARFLLTSHCLTTLAITNYTNNTMADAPNPIAVAIANKIAEIKQFQIDNFAGQTGVNPYLWLANNLKPLEDEFNNKGPSDALTSKLNALQFKEPPVGPFTVGGKGQSSSTSTTAPLKYTPKPKPVASAPQGLPGQATGVDLSPASGITGAKQA